MDSQHALCVPPVTISWCPEIMGLSTPGKKLDSTNIVSYPNDLMFSDVELCQELKSVLNLEVRSLQLQDDESEIDPRRFGCQARKGKLQAGLCSDSALDPTTWAAAVAPLLLMERDAEACTLCAHNCIFSHMFTHNFIICMGVFLLL